MYTHMFLHVHYPFSSFDTAKLSKIVFLVSLSTNLLKKKKKTDLQDMKILKII